MTRPPAPRDRRDSLPRPPWALAAARRWCGSAARSSGHVGFSAAALTLSQRGVSALERLWLRLWHPTLSDPASDGAESTSQHNWLPSRFGKRRKRATCRRLLLAAFEIVWGRGHQGLPEHRLELSFPDASVAAAAPGIEARRKLQTETERAASSRRPVVPAWGS